MGQVVQGSLEGLDSLEAPVFPVAPPDLVSLVGPGQVPVDLGLACLGRPEVSLEHLHFLQAPRGHRPSELKSRSKTGTIRKDSLP